jgi:CrcB protein
MEVNTIKKYIYIGVGGGTGATLRVLAKAIPFEKVEGLSIYNTLFVNLIGCFALAFFLSLALELFELEAELRLGIATGLMGGLTTFSTLCKEVHTLILGQSIVTGLYYGVISVLAGISCVYLGIIATRQYIALRERHI